MRSQTFRTFRNCLWGYRMVFARLWWFEGDLERLYGDLWSFSEDLEKCCYGTYTRWGGRRIWVCGDLWLLFRISWTDGFPSIPKPPFMRAWSLDWPLFWRDPVWRVLICLMLLALALVHQDHDITYNGGTTRNIDKSGSSRCTQSQDCRWHVEWCFP